eukprot:g9024.t1
MQRRSRGGTDGEGEPLGVLKEKEVFLSSRRGGQNQGPRDEELPDLNSQAEQLCAGAEVEGEEAENEAEEFLEAEAFADLDVEPAEPAEPAVPAELEPPETRSVPVPAPGRRRIFHGLQEPEKRLPRPPERPAQRPAERPKTAFSVTEKPAKDTGRDRKDSPRSPVELVWTL